MYCSQGSIINALIVSYLRLKQMSYCSWADGTPKYILRPDNTSDIVGNKYSHVLKMSVSSL